MMRRFVAVLVAGAFILGVAAVAYWAGTTAVVPPRVPVAANADQTYRVADGVVSKSFRVQVLASWHAVRTLLSASNGVVTSLPTESDDLAEAGDIIATISLEPVVVAVGAVPMFRPLELGVAGPDVAQFQGLLRSQGFLMGPADGRFGPLTVAATARWQRAIRAKRGPVMPGSLLFVERLPARLQVLASVGERTSVGGEFARVLADRPDFSAIVSASERAELASGMEIAVKGPEGSTWSGRLGAFSPRDDGRFSNALAGDLCGTTCGVIAIKGETALPGTIVTVPETKGPVVPMSALVQEPSGALTVTLSDGTRRPIEVLAQADGFAVVRGLEVGAIIKLPLPPSQ